MPAGPEHSRAALFALPRLSLPAILGFAVAGSGGAVFLAYASFSHVEPKYSIASDNDIPVYSARAVPFDQRPEDVAQRASAMARALTATRRESRSAEEDVAARTETSGPTLLADANRELRGFNQFSNLGSANSYLAITGANFGIAAQMSPSGFAAPDAETLTASAVPETSTWLCGAALLALVAARGGYATWHRRRRRTGR